MTRYQPLTYLLIYFFLSLLVFNFGPLEWENRGWEISSYLILIWFFLTLGYILGARIKLSNRASQNPKLNAKKIIKYGMFFNIITMPFAIYAYTGKLPTQISFDLSLQGEVHGQFYEHIIQSRGSTFRTVLSFIRALLAPFIYASIILGFKNWKGLNKKLKIYVLISVFTQVIFSFSRGTDKEIADLIIFFVLGALINQDKKIIKRLGKYILYILIFTMFFSLFLERKSARYNFVLPECISQAKICVKPENSFIAPMIGRNNYIGLGMFSNYFTQGYNGLSYAMKLDFKSTFGLGHAPILTRLYERITGDKTLYQRTYNYRLREIGWSDLYSWSTLYTWIANDVSFVLVPLVVFFLGLMLALSWRQATQYNNEIAYMSFAMIFLSFFYSPANNQLGISLEMLSTWYFWFIYWIYKSKFKN